MSQLIKITIEEITCHQRSEFKGRADNIYLQRAGQIEHFWPQNKKSERIKLGQTLRPSFCEQYYQHHESMTIELWEYDPGLGKRNDDFLGSITFDKDSSGRHKQLMRGDGGSYTVQYYVNNPFKNRQPSTIQPEKPKPSAKSEDKVGQNVPKQDDSSRKLATIKRLIICCDGTWQDLEKDYPTNVVKTAKAVKPIDSQGIHQVVYYDEGVGAESNISKKEDLTILGAGHRDSLEEGILGGSLGKGIDKNIQDAYRFLCLNYAPGDEIYLFGFSRGSYTVRSLAGMLSHCGLVRREHLHYVPEAYERYREREKYKGTNIETFRATYCHPNPEYNDRVPITLLACYDTVGSLGLPHLTLDVLDLESKDIPVLSKLAGVDKLPLDKIINHNRYAFHDTRLGDIVKNALHAVAVDEHRDTFSPTLMEKHANAENIGQTLHQVWFPGGHGCVGGGTERESRLANNALKWMVASIKEIGLNLEIDFDVLPDKEKVDGKLTDATFDYKKTDKGIVEKIMGLPIKAVKNVAMNAPGRSLREIPANDRIHRSVSERINANNTDYDPKNVPPNRRLSKEELDNNNDILLTS